LYKEEELQEDSKEERITTHKENEKSEEKSDKSEDKSETPKKPDIDFEITNPDDIQIDDKGQLGMF
ncbi:MAG TPA: hypothetical protein VKZ78_05655, partial [Sphingobacteriaceae bacterium]|nr:hypothetical protein [Sphingobacteriaceae bacterium]